MADSKPKKSYYKLGVTSGLNFKSNPQVTFVKYNKGPGFNNYDETKRLDQTDADYVDVYHTNSGFAGLNHSIGFYFICKI